MYLKEIGSEGVHWIQLPLYGILWRLLWTL